MQVKNLGHWIYLSENWKEKSLCSQSERLNILDDDKVHASPRNGDQ